MHKQLKAPLGIWSSAPWMTQHKEYSLRQFLLENNKEWDIQDMQFSKKRGSETKQKYRVLKKTLRQHGEYYLDKPNQVLDRNK